MHLSFFLYTCLYFVNIFLVLLFVLYAVQKSKELKVVRISFFIAKWKRSKRANPVSPLILVMRISFFIAKRGIRRSWITGIIFFTHIMDNVHIALLQHSLTHSIKIWGIYSVYGFWCVALGFIPMYVKHMFTLVSMDINMDTLFFWRADRARCVFKVL